MGERRLSYTWRREYAFKAKALIKTFTRPGMRLKRQAVLGPQMPIFVPLDKMSRKNLGYQVANLKELSEWNESFTRNRVKAVGAIDNFLSGCDKNFPIGWALTSQKVDSEFRIRS